MRMFCECGYFMTDVIIPNHTNLRLYYGSPLLQNNDLPEDKSTRIFHCECCHRLHFLPSKNDAQRYVYWLDKVTSSAQRESQTEHCEAYIKNDFDEVFTGTFADERKQLLIRYHDKMAVFMLESIFKINQLVYHTNHPETIIFDKSMVDRLLSASKIRCSCGWLINQQIKDDQSIINLYDAAGWVTRVKYEFGEEQAFSPIRGLWCEKCERLMLPNRNGKYTGFSTLKDTEHIGLEFRFLYYFIKPMDECMIDFDTYKEVPVILNKIYVSDSGEYLRVNKGQTITFYRAEDSESPLILQN